ncbi:hypothetical protein KJ841_02475 [Patescibacteria group bacterium]|nr:hypothetical protein [Patescibacteria group bacterium]
MNKNNEETRFESRVLTDPMDVLAVINHIEDNDKPLQVILTIKPRRLTETEYCSIKEPRIKTISVESEKEILEINKFLIEKLFIADIHVAIE